MVCSDAVWYHSTVLLVRSSSTTARSAIRSWERTADKSKESSSLRMTCKQRNWIQFWRNFSILYVSIVLTTLLSNKNILINIFIYAFKLLRCRTNFWTKNGLKWTKNGLVFRVIVGNINDVVTLRPPFTFYRFSDNSVLYKHFWISGADDANGVMNLGACSVCEHVHVACSMNLGACMKHLSIKSWMSEPVSVWNSGQVWILKWNWSD